MKPEKSRGQPLDFSQTDNRDNFISDGAKISNKISSVQFITLQDQIRSHVILFSIVTSVHNMHRLVGNDDPG